MKDINDCLKKISNLTATAYKEKITDSSGSLIVNIRGHNNKYNEQICKCIAQNFDKLKFIKETQEPKHSYCQNRKNNVYNFIDDSPINLTEKRIAICFYNMVQGIEVFDEPLHYETPIGENELGAVDLIYKDNNYINLIELKSGKSPETLLRAILEIYTYYKKINKVKFRSDFNLNSNLKFRLVLLLEETTISAQEANKLNIYNELLNLIKLIQTECPVKIYTFNELNRGIAKFNKNKEKTLYLENVDFSLKEITLI